LKLDDSVSEVLQLEPPSEREGRFDLLLHEAADAVTNWPR
jgi:hypothetical protein